ncbi:DUF167 domain-containing protein [Candidatus Falkowbacteria bacterium]|nr:DUF167 domain-containing protein [Candidatus Falkowbacteria bacterium]
MNNLSDLAKYAAALVKANEVYLRVKARPNAAKTRFKEIMADETIKIDVAAPAVKGKANQELIKFLAERFAVSKNNVKIISGAGERVKLVKIAR